MSKVTDNSIEAEPGLEKYLTGDFNFAEQREVIPSKILDLGDIAIKARTKTSLYVMRSAGVEVAQYTDDYGRTSTFTECSFVVARFSEVHYMNGDRFVQAPEFGVQRGVVPVITVGSFMYIFTDSGPHRTTPVQSLEIARLEPDQ